MGVGAAGPAREARRRARVTGDAVPTAGRDVTGIGRGAVGTLVPLARIGTIVAGVAAAGAHRRVVHRVGDEARRRVGVAVAALDAGHRDVRRRRLAGRGRAVVTVRAVRVGGRVDVCRPRPAGEAIRCLGVAGDAILAIRGQMASIGCGAQRALGALARVGAVVTGVAAARAHRRVVHRVGDEARRRVGVAVAALDAGTGCAAAWSCRSPSCRCGSSSNWCRQAWWA